MCGHHRQGTVCVGVQTSAVSVQMMASRNAALRLCANNVSMKQIQLPLARRAVSTQSGRDIAVSRRVAPCVMYLMLSACTGSTHLSFIDLQGPVAAPQREHFYWVLRIMTVLSKSWQACGSVWA